jgi:Putative addiction module component
MSTNPPVTEPRHDFPRLIDPEWDAMLARGEEPEIPEWHWEELARRRKMIEDGTAEYIPLEEVKARLEKKYGISLE